MNLEVPNRQEQPEPEPEPKFEPVPEFKPEPESESEPESEPEFEPEEEIEAEPIVPTVFEQPPPPPQQSTTIIVPEVMKQSNPEIEERFRTVSASLQDTKEAIERMEKFMMAGFASPPPSPHIHISFDLPRNPFGRYWKWIQMILIMILIWLFFESTLCAAYCKPTYASGPTSWRPYDPLFGRAIPYKLDEWTGVRVSRAWRDYWNY
jgi:hypothetical protein